VAVASAGPHASLNLTPETDNHASTPPLTQAGCPSCRPTNGVKALKALKEKLRETFTLSSCHSTDSQMEVTAPLKIRRRRIEDRGKCGHAPIENWPFPWGDLGPHLPHGSPGPHKSTAQTSQSVHSFLHQNQNSHNQNTGRQTQREHATYVIGCIRNGAELLLFIL